MAITLQYGDAKQGFAELIDMPMMKETASAESKLLSLKHNPPEENHAQN